MHPCSFLKQKSYSQHPHHPHDSLSATASLVGQQTKLKIFNFFTVLDIREGKERQFVVVFLQTQVITMNHCAVQALAEGRKYLC